MKTYIVRTVIVRPKGESYGYRTQGVLHLGVLAKVYRGRGAVGDERSVLHRVELGGGGAGRTGRGVLAQGVRVVVQRGRVGLRNWAPPTDVRKRTHIVRRRYVQALHLMVAAVLHSRRKACVRYSYAYYVHIP